MKIEIEKDFPQYFKPAYPEEFELFSHFEVTAGIPTVLFAITTWKENGKPNVCFHSWSCFHGDKTAFFAVMGNLYQHTHTSVSYTHLVDQDDLESAEEVFLTAIETQPTNAGLYQAAIDFYMDTEQPQKIAALLAECEDENVLDAVSDYVSAAPEFTPEEGTYTEVQEITISSDTGGDIYYTTDGTDPTAETGTRYTEPVLLQTEGETEIRAIAVNSKGIPSVVSSQKYTIEFPIVDAPAVTPSTGRYTDPEQITITDVYKRQILYIVCLITKGELYGCQIDKKQKKHKEQA